MHAESFLRRIGTGCFVMMLLPAGAALAQGRQEARLDACAPVAIARTGAFEGARIFGATSHTAAPWFRRTFVVVRMDGTCAVKPVKPAARAARAAPETQPPGIVRNLRRTDQR
jgi:hypothetical protein